MFAFVALCPCVEIFADKILLMTVDQSCVEQLNFYPGECVPLVSLTFVQFQHGCFKPLNLEFGILYSVVFWLVCAGLSSGRFNGSLFTIRALLLTIF